MDPKFRIFPPDPPNDGIMFVDHSVKDRSGHLGHALVEYEDNKILAFYANCSDANEKMPGHSADGWMEFKRSVDGGRTWGTGHILDYSRDTYEKGIKRAIMCEKAVATDTGKIILFNLVCDISETPGWEPYFAPTYLASTDGGHSWSRAKNLSERKGRVYDALFRKGTVFALHFCNHTWAGATENDQYCLHASTDDGETFSERSTLPFDTIRKAYGTMEFMEDGSLIAYIYNARDENRLEYVISRDDGFTWSEVKTAYFARKIRNPQLVYFENCYFLHGRSGQTGEEKHNLVLYTSKDGINWDNGIFLNMRGTGTGAYSNNLVVGARNPEGQKRLLIQASHAYEHHKTNILHWWIDKK